MALTPNSLARRKPGVQIPSPPPPNQQVRASSASSGRRSLHVAAALRPRAQVPVQPGRLAATRRLGPGPHTVTTERGHRLQPELRICCDPRQSGPEATLAHADGRAVRGYGRTARPGPSWPCGCPPHRRAPRTHRCGHSGTRTQNARTPTRDTGHPHPDIGQPTRGHRIRGHWTVKPDTGHWTPDAWSYEYADRVT